MKNRCVAGLLWLCVLWPGVGQAASGPADAAAKTVFVLPIRDDIFTPLVYLIRRGVKEALDAKADVLLIDMETNGGSVSATEEIIEILNKFKGETITFVNKKAFSAGAFIAVATQKIYMAPQSVIGAAAPIMMIPGAGPTEMPNTLEVKMTSGVRAMVRAAAEKNGHNVEVVEAMIDKSKELKIDGKTLNEKGQILTLTNKQAEEKYGDPPKPLLSLGTVESVDELLTKLGYASVTRREIQPTGVERLASWINAISPLLLIVGVVGIYLELKTPGFGVPGIVGILAFALYFFGGYVAGLSGLEWVALFILGLVLVAVELFLYPGTIVLGVTGGVLMLLSLIMAMVDTYPGMPTIPKLPDLSRSMTNLLIAVLGSMLAIWGLSLWLPKTPLYSTMVSQSTSGVSSVAAQEQEQRTQLGQIGVAMSVLRPGGKARFGDQILDVVTQGDLIAKGQRVRIIGHSGREAIVELVT
jgi:membrane-bound serine protease (ClpP class)